ncbi:MAG: hypothetical protein Q8R81_09660 [Novosphingobium sp.]|nr:hypothetical protein [Novosphingobium sp.]
MKELEQYRLNAAAHLLIAREEQSREIVALREKIEAITADIALQGIAFTRATRPLPEGKVCPRCWIWDGKLIELGCVPSASKADIYKCPTCKEHITTNAAG